MKVRRRSVPLDSVSVESKDRLICITTHHHSIHLTAYKGLGRTTAAHHEFTFDQLFRLLEDLRPGIADICTPP